MGNSRKIEVPDIGDFQSVEVIEVLVAPGDQVQPEQALITLESDKASMDIPAPCAGTVLELLVQAGTRVSQGSTILMLESAGIEADTAPAPTGESGAQISSAPATNDDPTRTEVVVLGAGPGGYAAAFRAADLGKRTLLIERHPRLGGVCLNVGCIPSKALLHIARVLTEVEELEQAGVHFRERELKPKSMRAWTQQIINRLTNGLSHLARQRKVQVLHGEAHFTSPHTLEVQGEDGTHSVSFEHAIIAAGSRVQTLPGQPEDARILDSTNALELASIPGHLLVVGGGIIGLEMATVYQALGTKITIVEMFDRLLGDCDPDMVRPLQKQLARRCEQIHLGTRVAEIRADQRLEVCFDGENAPPPASFDALLVATGRRPNADRIGIEAIGLQPNEAGFIPVDDQQRTAVPHVYAIGDIAGQPMLAHKATHEGKIAAEVIAGLKSGFDDRVIPSVAYTDPELAWVGLTETQARQQGIKYGKGVFPWAASGRSLALGRDEGLTKLLFDQQSGRLLGMAAVGPGAGDLIAEGALAIEMGCDAQDIGLTIHPHPTLAETVGLAAEAFEGTITDLYLPRS